MTTYTHLSLFSGIGGLDLAAEWAGFETVGQCEYADYPTKILEKHWPHVPRWKDIRDLTGESFYEQTNKRTVDVISGGFPCQPFSVAGKQQGERDDRYLWPEMLRVIWELRPTWVIGENVAGIINLALDTVLSQLEEGGYETRTFVFPAHAVGAPHRRDRVFIVGHAKHDGLSSAEIRRGIDEAGIRESKGEETTSEFKRASGRKNNAVMADSEIARSGRLSVLQRGPHEKSSNINRCSQNVADTFIPRLQGREEAGDVDEGGENADKQPMRCSDICDSSGKGLSIGAGESMGGQETSIEEFKRSNCNGREWWATEPRVGRVAHGISNRVDRIKCLGNAVVPQQAYPIFRAIIDIERRNRRGGHNDNR